MDSACTGAGPDPVVAHGPHVAHDHHIAHDHHVAHGHQVYPALPGRERRRKKNQTMK